MTISEMQSGIGSMPSDPEQRKVDKKVIDAISERSMHLRIKTGREGNSHPQFLTDKPQTSEMDIPREE